MLTMNNKTFFFDEYFYAFSKKYGCPLGKYEKAFKKVSEKENFWGNKKGDKFDDVNVRSLIPLSSVKCKQSNYEGGHLVVMYSVDLTTLCPPWSDHRLNNEVANKPISSAMGRCWFIILVIYYFVIQF